ncbi:MAG TPA: RNA polymerase sigma factor [Gammaproteobacteria bacterium]|nr:RNA polymerase sigma factor [Gammaproteobacteria bacterium]
MPKPFPQIEAAVLVRAQRGDREAHALLYDAFAAMVYTLARRMLASTTLAEDVLQETFVEVIRKIGSYRGDAEFGFWVKRVAINKCLMHLRSGWMARRVETDDVEALSEGHSSDGHDDEAALQRALAELSDTARAVVWLHDVEGYTHKEIGRMMGRTASFSKSQLARAHDRLRTLLQGALDESEPQLCTPVLKPC